MISTTRLRSACAHASAWPGRGWWRTPLTGRIPWVLELGQEVMSPNRFAVLPVRFGPGDWSVPQVLERYPRIEEVDADLCVIAPDSRSPVPLSRWLRPTV